jgi:5'-deoxynucleotidase YfbR-like HD superfamily hydrolase
MIPLLRELGHLKRITSAGRSGSIATRLFRQAWSALIAGAEAGEVMQVTVAAALAAARLGDLDSAKLRDLGLSAGDALTVLERSFDAVSGAIDDALASRLRSALGRTLPQGDVPSFVDALCNQPRAGVTCPGKPRLVLQPAENHAEHSWTVALYGVLLAPFYEADPAEAFLAGLAHHFHNAAMPDSGFTGEVLLGDLLDGVIERARLQALGELPDKLRATFTAVILPIGSDRTAQGRTFNAADVIDRVLEIEQHLLTREATMASVLGDYELVHAGPVKGFHDRVLGDVGLL